MLLAYHLARLLVRVIGATAHRFQLVGLRRIGAPDRRGEYLFHQPRA